MNGNPGLQGQTNNKEIIAMELKLVKVFKLTVAAFAVVTSVHAGTIYEKDGTRISFFGRINGNLIYDSGDSTTEFKNEGSRLGFKGEHPLDIGAIAYGNFEARFDGIDRTTTFSPRNTYFGIKGGFGDVRIGDFDSIFGDLISEVNDIFNSSVSDYYNLGDKHGGGRGIAYFNKLEWFNLAVMLTHQAKDEAAGQNEAVNVQAVVGVPVNDMIKINLGINQDQKDFGQGDPIFGASAEIGLNDVDIGLQAEYQNDNATVLGISGKYGYGAMDIYGLIGMKLADSGSGDNDELRFVAGTSYKLSGKLRSYVESSHTSRSGGSGNTEAAVGMRYDF